MRATARGEVARAAGSDGSGRAMGGPGPARRSARSSRAGLRLVHGGLSHRRPAGRESNARHAAVTPPERHAPRRLYPSLRTARPRGPANAMPALSALGWSPRTMLFEVPPIRTDARLG